MVLDIRIIDIIYISTRWQRAVVIINLKGLFRGKTS